MDIDRSDFEGTLAQLQRLEKALFSLQGQVVPNASVIDAIRVAQYQEVTRLRALLDEMYGIANEDKADMVIRLEGPEVALGLTPASILSSALESVRGSLQTVAAYVSSQEVPKRGRYPGWIEEACDLRVGGFTGGSLKILLSLPPDRSLFAPLGWSQAPVRESIGLILETATWVSSQGGLDVFANIVTDERLRRLLLIQMLRLTPSRVGRVRRIELSGRRHGIRMKPALVPQSASRIRGALERDGYVHSRVSEEGVLRAIDLDTGDVQLRQRPDDQPDIRCACPQDVLIDALEAIVKRRRVLVVGIWESDSLGRNKRLHVEEIHTL